MLSAAAAQPNNGPLSSLQIRGKTSPFTVSVVLFCYAFGFVSKSTIDQNAVVPGITTVMPHPEGSRIDPEVEFSRRYRNKQHT